MAENLSSPNRVRELSKQLERGTYRCAMNCYSCIRRKDNIWFCIECFHMCHWNCIAQWVKRRDDNAPFFCPLCQHEQPAPSICTCFCGAVQNPLPDPGITPHSCGRPCQRSRGLCPHPCPLLCHPGPCPPCLHVVGPVSCPCGGSYTYKCGMEDPKKTCTNTCGKVLNCGKHYCTAVCHHGECDICMIETEVSCNCGRDKRSLLCGSSFQCANVCGKSLSCTHHTCTLVCHNGKCPPCPLSPEVIQYCWCGKSMLRDERKSCLDPIPSCGKPCRKWLSCGRHRCPRECHSGECPPCTEVISATCLCRKGGKRMIPCAQAEAFRCERTCCTPLSCGRHKCMEKCCPDCGDKSALSHVCHASCDKKFPCEHSCPLPCHRGRCPDCVVTIPTFLTCRCGRTLSAPPPLPCGTLPPECTEPCSLTRICGHSNLDHKCHFGECPPCKVIVERECVGHHDVVEVECGSTIAQCKKICGKNLPCGHLCLRLCHGGECEDKKNCKQACGKIREWCHHFCKRPCHSPEQCPECTQKVKLTCACGNNSQQEKCCVSRGKYFPNEKTTEESYKGVLACNAHCDWANRLKALSSIRKSSLDGVEFVFLESLYLLGIVYTDYLNRIEKELQEFTESDQTFLALPPASKEKRKLTHLLCRYSRMDSHSEDFGDKRSCMVFKTPYTALCKHLLSNSIRDGINPTNFMKKKKKQAKLQLFTSVGHAQVVNTLVTLLGTFTFHEPEEAEELCIYFTSRQKRDAACAILREKAFPFTIGEDHSV